MTLQSRQQHMKNNKNNDIKEMTTTHQAHQEQQHFITINEMIDGIASQQQHKLTVGSPQVSFPMCTLEIPQKIAVQVLLLLTLFTFTFEPFLKL